MTVPQYYIMTTETPEDNANWVSSLQAILSDAVTELITNGATSNFTFLVGSVVSGATQYAYDELNLEIKLTPDESEIQIGDELYPLDVVVDAAITTAVTSAILAAVSINPLTVIGLAVAGGVGYVYSKFVDPITEDVLTTLDGKDMVQFFDSNGDEVAGMIFPDGITGYATDAVHSFISHPSSIGLDLTAGHIQLDTNIFIDDTYIIKDGTVFQDIATRLGVSLATFLSASSGSYSNDEYYAIGADGNPYVFYAESFSALDQKLAIEVTIDGVGQIVNVNTVYIDGSLVWGDAVNGHTGNNLVLTANGGGNASGISFINDLILGSDQNDNINTNSSLLATGDTDTVLAGAGDDTVTGGYGQDHIEGGLGNDVIDGEDGDDTLLGGSGNDTITAGDGDDVIDGGAGTDTLDFSYESDDITIDLVNNTAVVDKIIDDNNTVYNIENINTGSGDDTITGNSVRNIINAGGGADTVDGGAGDDLIDGGSGSDILYGGDDVATVSENLLNNDASAWAGNPLLLALDYDDAFKMVA